MYRLILILDPLPPPHQTNKGQDRTVDSSIYKRVFPVCHREVRMKIKCSLSLCLNVASTLRQKVFSV